MLGSGFSAKKILDFLMKKSPEMAPKITKALASGLTAEKVVSFFSKDKNFDKLKASMEKAYPMNNNANPMVQGESIRGQNLGTDMASGLQRSVGPAMGTAAMAGGTYALSRAIPAILQKGQAASLPALQAGNQQQTPQIQSMSSQPPLAPAQAQNVPPTIPQPTQPMQPEGKTIENIRSMPDLLWNQLEGGSKKSINPEVDGFMKMAQRMRTTGEITSKEDFDKFYSLFEAKKGEGMSLPKALKEATSEYDKQKMPQPEAMEEEAKPLAKNETVASPHGVGEVKEIRGDKALVEVDGKLHKVPVDELEEEPKEIKELNLDDAVSDYLARIPEGQKSSVIDVSLYDESTNELQIRFPNGDQWIYGPIPEEVFEKINSMTGIPVSSGESKLRGTIWEKDVANSAGADFSKLIRKFVKEGKVKERKLKTGIDLFKGFTRVKKRK
jgi:hypothetical protein